jgi:hypothetical protein
VDWVHLFQAMHEWRSVLSTGRNLQFVHNAVYILECVRFEVFTAVTMKNVVFWDIKPISYFTGDTLRLRYSVQPVNAM